MKRFIFFLMFVLTLTSILSINAHAPFIFKFEDKFSVKTPIIEKDSLVSFEDKMIQTKDNVTFTYQDKEFSVPIYEDLIETQDSICTEEDIFVVSDIEGNFEALYLLLEKAKVIDDKGHWIFDRGHLVIVGDMVDRGEFVNESLLLIYKLDYEAEEAGGKVHYLLGNHDQMLLTGDLRYVHPKYQYIGKALNQKVNELYGQNTLLGQWMRSKKVVLKINDMLFVHAGISKELISDNYSIEEINQLFWEYLNHQKLSERTNLLLKSKGPIWYRGLVGDSKISEEEFNQVLSYFKVNRVIIGHTIVDSVSTDYHDHLIRVDVYHIERPQGLKITQSKFYRIDINKEKELLF